MKHTPMTYLVYGATGGIGRAVVRALRDRGDNVIAGGRSPEKLEALIREEGLTEAPFAARLDNPGELTAAFGNLATRPNGLDGIIVTAGYDVRKFHRDLSDGEILETVSTNLTGVAFLLRTALPLLAKQGRGSFTVVGGFGDGRLAFPGHALDAASRAAVFTLLEGVGREHPGLQTLYFCPPAVDTAAERPWFPLWKELGVRIITPEQAALELVKVLESRRRWHMVGTPFDRFGIRLNAGNSRLADRIFLGGMSRRIIRFIKARS